MRATTAAARAPPTAAGADPVSTPRRHADDPLALIARVRARGMRVGIALKPGTPVDAVLPFVDAVDLVLVMTVEPGFGGQAFQPDTLPKVRRLRQSRAGLRIQVDGGIGPANIAAAAAAGANVIVAGTSVFRAAAGPRAAIAELRAAVAAALVQLPSAQK